MASCAAPFGAWDGNGCDPIQHRNRYQKNWLLGPETTLSGRNLLFSCSYAPARSINHKMSRIVHAHTQAVLYSDFAQRLGRLSVGLSMLAAVSSGVAILMYFVNQVAFDQTQSQNLYHCPRRVGVRHPKFLMPYKYHGPFTNFNLKPHSLKICDRDYFVYSVT